MSRRTAAELTAMADSLVAFRERFEELLTHTATFPGGPVGEWQVPMDDREDDVDRLKGEVSTLAGAAQAGIVVTGSTIDTFDQAGRHVRLNPVAGWLTVLQPRAMLEPDDVLNATRLAEGKLRADAEAARREERSLAGRIAALIGLPTRVRELLGLDRDSRAGKATQVSVAAVLVSLLVAVVGGVITAAVVAVLQIGQ